MLIIRNLLLIKLSCHDLGITESISFNVSSMVPPSPIPPTCTVQCYMRTRSKTNDTPLPAADIVLSLPEDGYVTHYHVVIHLT